MIIKNNKIIESTERELLSYWSTRKLEDAVSFPEYIDCMKDVGVIVKKEEESNELTKGFRNSISTS